MKQHLPNQINLFEAKTHFSNLIQRVQDGEQITICKHNTPVAKLIPITERPKIENIVEKFAEFSKGKTLAPYTIKELRDEDRR
ncbi:MAG: type II toxin-antitoxin system Phd/YefM family antitoxin [Rickettsia endosymbiont of Ixodes persulcatus]|nr:type II toxin-antitoxin system Phd/YefM family antitoxin [Rickettsia endosymbiont of Ixodes persulcatus]MCZ6902820.1 type II toxin-antitoxin system Phd/YefM family antitoxin [Rickettsia endosymbiont of Ixodes persulcatus]MCZ6908877.1 type II toxin-antitoxin system Phd/YefM family antitoxin [Rickettsia endosymbiont of Ixodes persulcatus]MCZ6910355.1 type II toxin-antitoxin system Phd/YefM family antitoxin [Rickettsia endosymbiont of Ixodes persulcatus]MCZ6913573.1 type II toxin-antitoxin syst